ncbi:MAG: hypothetical protein JJU27_19625 [Gammaproteobacteria bacterium]|nr:hypothetical protein [Gammaproteobacteria bacterium]
MADFEVHLDLYGRTRGIELVGSIDCHELQRLASSAGPLALPEILLRHRARQSSQLRFKKGSQILRSGAERIPGEYPSVSDHAADQDARGLQASQLPLDGHVGDIKSGRNPTGVAVAIVLQEQ